jgi:hypothetical protein
MRSAAFLSFFFFTAGAFGQEKIVASIPAWTATFQIDHISLPFHSKFRPSQTSHKLLRSWSISFGRVLKRFDLKKSTYTNMNIGFLKNTSLQKGLLLNIQQGYMLQTEANRGALLQTALEAGCLLLFGKGSSVGDSGSAGDLFRLQWTGGILLNAGVKSSDETSYSAAVVSYKLWFQGPFIKKYAPAMPHEALGLQIYK